MKGDLCVEAFSNFPLPTSDPTNPVSSGIMELRVILAPVTVAQPSLFKQQPQQNVLQQNLLQQLLQMQTQPVRQQSQQQQQQLQQQQPQQQQEDTGTKVKIMHWNQVFLYWDAAFENIPPSLLLEGAVNKHHPECDRLGQVAIGNTKAGYTSISIYVSFTHIIYYSTCIFFVYM